MTEFLGILVGLAVMAGAPAYFVLQPMAIRRLAHGWKIAAMVPLPFAATTIAWSLYALADDSNLWPITFIFFVALASPYLLFLLLFGRQKMIFC